ncbi:MAG TPA: hypothetical protein VMR28_03620 [Candidatus Saccharimonadales bacterium]|nr:hypothetical protein [Candidatus Saccharimonadales bacterium]
MIVVASLVFIFRHYHLKKSKQEQTIDSQNISENGAVNAHKQKFSRVLIVISVVGGVIVLGIIAYIALLALAFDSPGNSYVEQFEKSQVSSLATSTRSYLQGVLSAPPMGKNGFSYISSGYIDGCYADNGDGTGPWKKICQAELINMYASKSNAGLAEQQLIPIMQNANWQPEIPYTYSTNCFGYAAPVIVDGHLDELFALNLGYTPNYEVSSLVNGCSVSNSLVNSSGTPIDTDTWILASNLQPVIYSNLTNKLVPNKYANQLTSQGYKSFVIITVSKQYFDKNLSQQHYLNL